MSFCKPRSYKNCSTSEVKLTDNYLTAMQRLYKRYGVEFVLKAEGLTTVYDYINLLALSTKSTIYSLEKEYSEILRG